MWLAIFDFQQEIALRDSLDMDDLMLLFYFEKNILCRTGEDEKITLYKNFEYRTILKDIPLLRIQIKQLKNLIFKLVNAGYILLEKSYPGEIRVRLQKRAFEILTPRHSAEFEIEKYFELAGWKNISKSWKFISNSGNLFPTHTPYNNIYTNTNKVVDINDYIDTTHARERETEIFNIIFKKYPRFSSEKNLSLPKGFDLNVFLKRMSASQKFLEVNQRFTLQKIFENYEKFESGFYDDLPTVKKEGHLSQARHYSKKQLDSLFDDLNEINV